MAHPYKLFLSKYFLVYNDNKLISSFAKHLLYIKFFDLEYVWIFVLKYWESIVIQY